MTLFEKIKWGVAMLIAAQPLSAQPDKKETCRVPVLLVAGQSNTDGRVPNQDMPDNLKAYGKANGGHFRWAQWCYGSSGKIQTRDSLNNSLFAPYWPFVAKEDNHDRHGYDTYAYYLLEQEWQRPFYIIKWSLGGTAIHPKASSTGGKHWCAMPEYLAENQSTLRGGKSLLKSFIEELNLCLDGPLAQLKEGYDIKAMLWHQGESDYQHGKDYYEQLRAVVLYVRKHLVEKTGDKRMADLPFICGTVSRQNKCYNQEVEEGMYKLQRDLKNFYVIDMQNGVLQRDKLHFVAASAEELGRGMVEKMKEVGATALTPAGLRCSVAKFRGDKRAAISLTYDDGLKEHIDLVAPELERRGLRGSFWIIGNKIGAKDSKHGDRMTYEELRELHRREHEVGSHTWSHPNLIRLDNLDSVRWQMQMLDSAFLANGLPKPMTMAYPYNAGRGEIVRVVEEGRIGSRTFQVGHGQQNNKSTLESMTAWMHRMIDTYDWGVTMTHAILHGYDQWYHPEELWQFYDTLKAHEKDIWVGTFGQCCAYQKERKAIRLNTAREGKRLIITPTLPLDKQIFHEPLTLRIEGFRIAKKKPKVRQDKKSLKPYWASDGALLVDFDPFAGDIVVQGIE
ncbi:MAG: polysaccharide deacetylase family protein [Bacteroidaceae bacterium]|nr:polysaccharide deacetylase family protein [Bacteroidaceae bacterium]